MLSKKQALKELAVRKARGSFVAYCFYMDHSFFTKRMFLMPLLISLNAAWYCLKQRTTLNYAMPRRTGKTYVTKFYCSWSLSKDVTREIIYAKHKKADAIDEVNAIIQIMRSAKHQAIFPDCLKALVVDSAEKKHWSTHYRASLVATSILSGSTGQGCGLLIVDDAYRSAKDALSAAINDRTISNYLTTLVSSLDNENNIELIVGTRWCFGELADILERQNRFDESIKIRAENEDGTSFCESIISTEELLQRKRLARESGDIQSYEAMYNQEPMLLENALFERGHFRYFTEKQMQDMYVYSRFIVLDPKGSGKDGFAVGLFAVTDQMIILEDVIHTYEVLSEELVNRTASFANAYYTNYIFIEVNGDPSLPIWLGKKVSGMVKEFRTTQNKEEKIITNAFRVKAHIGLLQTDDKEYTSFLNELFKFDYQKKDQQDGAADVLTIGVKLAYENASLLGYKPFIEERGS